MRFKVDGTPVNVMSVFSPSKIQDMMGRYGALFPLPREPEDEANICGDSVLG